MSKKRWKLGNYELTYNPKSTSITCSTSGEVATTANGRLTFESDYYDEKLSFSFDIYNKPTQIFKELWISFASGAYRAMGIDDIRSETYLLDAAGNTVRVFNAAGQLVRSFTPTGAAGTILAFCYGDSELAYLWSSNELTFSDENGAFIRKYSYSDSDLLDICDLSQNYLTGKVYGINTYGKIFLLDSSSSLVLQFSDFASNQTKGLKSYHSICSRSDGFLSIFKNRTMMFLNSNLEVCYGLEIDRLPLHVTSLSSGPDAWLMFPGEIRKARLNLAGLEVEKLRSNFANGIVLLTDENSVSRFFSIQSADIQRIRNKQDARYTLTINGTLL